jgi:chorismate mutase
MADSGMACRGIRGAIIVEGEGPDAVQNATEELLDRLVGDNDCRLDDIAAAIFTVTDDLPGANPAAAARAHGWDLVPLLVVREHGGTTEVSRCLRVLVLWNTTRDQADIRHAYLGRAAVLRPDLGDDDLSRRQTWSS